MLRTLLIIIAIVAGLISAAMFVLGIRLVIKSRGEPIQFTPEAQP